jgi:glycosyltransferase involved in cell wall biosynthesis
MSGDERLVTFGIICCQQRSYITSVLDGAFRQTYRPLEVVVSDDASTDGTFRLAVELSRRHPAGVDVALHRNDTRLGIGNCDRMVGLAKGEFVVMAHGDDISVPHRVERLVDAWRTHDCSMVTSNAVVIDENGKELGPYAAETDSYDLSAEALASGGWNKAMLGAVLGFEPAVFTHFGPLDPARSAFVHDWILPYRAALLKGIRYLPEPLVLYRVHGGNYTSLFLNAPADDAEHVESHQANSILQFHYMLSDTRVAYEKGLVSRERAIGLANRLQQSIVAASRHFSFARNRLLSSGRRARWLAPEA